MPPFRHPITVRFRDLDSLGHVNNAVYLTYLEEARVAFFQSHTGTRGARGFGFLLARAEVDFRRSIEPDHEVVAELWLEELGNKSFRFGYHLLADGEVAAEAQTVQVYVDERGRTVRVPDEVREVLATLER